MKNIEIKPVIYYAVIFIAMVALAYIKVFS